MLATVHDKQIDMGIGEPAPCHHFMADILAASAKGERGAVAACCNVAPENIGILSNIGLDVVSYKDDPYVGEIFDIGLQNKRIGLLGKCQ